MGSNVERLLEEWLSFDGEFLDCRFVVNRLAAAVEADREEGIEVKVERVILLERHESDRALDIWTYRMTAREEIDRGDYTLIKREAGDSE